MQGFLALDQISARARGRVVVAELTLALARGQRLALLGGPGAGKTAVLLLLTGFLRPHLGAIRLDGRDISALAPERRNIAAVFQEDTVFPHLSVAENVAYALRLRGHRRTERRQEAARTLGELGLAALLGRHPARLEPAQRRLLALARAAAAKPALLLVDEPAQPADAPAREAVRAALSAAPMLAGMTTVFATRDHAAAFALADAVALLQAGRLVQAGTPRELYERPASRLAAVASGACNLLDARLLGRDGDGIARLALPGGPARAQAAAGLPPGPVLLCVRPNRVHPDRHGPVRGPVESIAYLGGLTRITLRLPESPFVAELHEAPAGLARGQELSLGWRAGDAWALPAAP
jgi:ABC-type Fe3+/spermidine/putrescine transport system ATPase subunit